MVRHGTTSEYLLTQKTAEEYRSRGYEVVQEAPLDFLPGFTADLLVRKGDEVKVIEVKSRPSLAADPRIGELARRIESRSWTHQPALVRLGARTSLRGSKKRRRLLKRACQRLPSCSHGRPMKPLSGQCSPRKE